MWMTRSRTHHLLLGALAANCCLAQAAVAQWQAPEGPDAAIEQSRVAAQLLTTNGRVQIPGVSVAVVLDGHVVWADAFGYANVELRAPSTQDTRFRIASISKTFTGTLLARLAEAGRLDLDAHIRTIDPDLPEHYDAVTVRQLARHTAGVRSYATGEVAVPDYYETLADALQVFINDPLLFEPGASYRYSTYGYTLLGHVMEKACGESYYELLRKYVLEPLDLRTVALDHRYFIRQNRAEHYEWSQQYGVTNAQPLDNSVKYPGGGLIATADDLARFGYAMAAPGFLSEEALKGMLSPTILPDGSEVDDSAGWTLRQDGRGRRVYGHSGAQPGTRSQMWVYPQLGVAMAVLSNLSNRPLGFDEFQVLAEPFVKLAEGHEPGPAAVDATGSYRFEIQLDDEETLTGTLDVWPKALGGGYGASIHVDRDGSGFELPSVAVHGRDVRIVGFTVGQLIELDFELSDDGAGTGTAMVGRMRPLTVSRR